MKVRISRLSLALAAVLAWPLAPAAAQGGEPRDTIRLGPPPSAAADTLRLPDDPGTTAAPESASRWGTPFAVEASGSVEKRPPRAALVWTTPDTTRRAAARVATVPAAPPPDTTGVQPARPAARPDTPRVRTPAPRPTPPAGRAAARARTHTVAPGETFYGLARRYGVTSAALRQANPDARWESLRTGDVLRIPAPAAGVRPGARPVGATPARGGTASRARRTHTVERGETLFGIARRYGVPARRIQEANGMRTDQVRIGQTLVIPAA